ncbi:MAG TPA: WD40 repeat domain-containing serine/threonine-protein kinase [Candidatus Dormibacteraeota bacterium]|nr:WD40 repeat domain-containing serine/threonine-protein kinase [Candidatus Dormibacteraeota bacterium]
MPDDPQPDGKTLPPPHESTAAAPLGTIDINAQLTGKPGDTIGRYKIREQIGQGGCGTVFVAEQQEPVRRRVALKVIKLGMDTRQVIARFEAERQALAMMDHPNIAKVLDAGSSDSGRPFFVMELVRGIKITDYCDQHKLSTTDRLKLFTQVCQAVQHAHQKGIIHRDLKPSNILVTLHDSVPVPKVIDFGIAKATADQKLTDKTVYTALEQFIGTPAYMSPEQAEMSGLDIDTRSDIYSLGVLLYELLTGETPFKPEELLALGLDAMRRTLREKDPARPSTKLSTMLDADLTAIAQHRQADPPKLIKSVRGDLDWIVMKCLEKDRTRRYETANGLAVDIQRHLTSEPVVARPPSSLYRFQKLARRNRAAFAAMAAICVTLLTGAGIASCLYIRERQARRESETAKQNEARQRVQAESAEQVAKSSAEQVKVALASSDFLQAGRLIADQERTDALAYLVRSLSLNPTNEAALTRLTTLLAYHSWGVPKFTLNAPASTTFGTKLFARLSHPVQFSPDGRRILTTFRKETARVRDAESGQLLVELEAGVSAQFSPDSKRLLTTSTNAAQLWDSQTGKLIAPPLANGGQVWSPEFSSDGRRILARSQNRIRVWDGNTGQSLSELIMTNNLISAHFSSDGVRILTLSGATRPRPGALPANRRPGTNQVQLWNATNGQMLIELAQSESVDALLSPDGRLIITRSLDSERVWAAATGLPVTEPLNDSRQSPERTSLERPSAFSPDSASFLTISNNEVCIRDSRNGAPLTETLKDKSPVTAAEFSADGNRILTISGARGTFRAGLIFRTWDAKTGQPLMEPKKLSAPVELAAFSRDGRRVVTTSGENAWVWNAENGELLLGPLSQGSPFLSAEWNPNGKSILTLSASAVLRVWEARSSEPPGARFDHGTRLRSAEFSPDGRHLLTASEQAGKLENGRMVFTTNGLTGRLWDVQSGQPEGEPMEFGGPLQALQFAADGKTVVSCSTHGPRTFRSSTQTTNEVRVWDAQSGRPLNETIPVAGRAVPAPDGTHILVVKSIRSGAAFATNCEAQLLEAQTGRPLTELVRFASGPVARIAFDGLRMAAQDAFSARITVWDLRTGRQIGAFPSSSAEEGRNWPFDASVGVLGAVWPRFSPGGRVLWVAGGVVYICDTRKADAPPLLLQHAEAVGVARFSPDGAKVVTAAGEEARIWDAATGQLLTGPLRHGDPVFSAEFNPHCNQLLTIAPNGTVRLWDTESGQPLMEPIVEPPHIVDFNHFSPDGTRIALASGSTAHVLDVAPHGPRCPEWLLPLAEAIGGIKLTADGRLEPTKLNRAQFINELRRKLSETTAQDDWVRWGRWFLADPATRTVSPFSQIAARK